VYININKENIQNIDEHFQYDRSCDSVVTDYMFNVTQEFLQEFSEESINYNDVSEVEHILNYEMFLESIGDNKFSVFDEDYCEWAGKGYSNKYDVTFVCKFLRLECDRVFFEILVESEQLVR
jgi:hypothetical protein